VVNAAAVMPTMQMQTMTLWNQSLWTQIKLQSCASLYGRRAGMQSLTNGAL
jgi:hypothetical protein